METIKLYEIKKNNTDFESVNIKSSYESSNFIRKFYGDDLEVYESFFILLLNRANDTIGYAKISQGGIVGTIVDVKIIAKYVVDSLASGIILAHNHPSGNKNPSQADIDITKKIKEALIYFDCNIIDHIILTKNNYTSFADESLI